MEENHLREFLSSRIFLFAVAELGCRFGTKGEYSCWGGGGDGGVWSSGLLAAAMSVETYATADFDVELVQLDVPLHHDRPQGKISICAKVVSPPHYTKTVLYLQGGPGYPAPDAISTSSPGFLKPLLKRSYRVVLLDQRGTGLSSPIHPEITFEEILAYRADSIVKDCELLRNHLGVGKWTLLGQSYGGFLSITYLSLFSESIETVLITGGMPPLLSTVDEVYAATFKKQLARNLVYYEKFPNDNIYISYIINYLSTHKVILPNGGIFDVDRFRSFGLVLGTQNGVLALHLMIFKIYTELKFGKLTYGTKNQIMNFSGFETNTIYFLLQESIYLGNGMSSNWSAERTLAKQDNLQKKGELKYNNKVIPMDMFLFTGEIVSKSMLASYAELRKLSDLACKLHEYDSFGDLFNFEKLSTIKWEDIPIVVQLYYNDPYVDFDNALKCLNTLEFKFIVRNDLLHNGLHISPDDTLDGMFKVLKNGDL